MTSLLGKALALRALPANTLDARDAIFGYGGNQYPTGAIAAPTGAGNREGGSSSNYEQSFRNTLISDGPVAACFLARRMLLSEARFVWQRMQRGRPTTIFGSAELALLEAPWPNGTTGQLLARMSDLEGLAGNAFVVRRGEARLGDERLVVPRPDWITIVGGSRYGGPADVWDLDVDVIGYLYFPGGPLSGRDPVPLLVEDVAHYAPNPDPLSKWRGMSWLTPVLREIESDKAATDHKAAFFRNGASPQIVVSFDAAIKQDQVLKMAAQLNALTTGTGNAYKTLYLGGGADVTVVGRDLAQLDFANTQGRDETRIAAAAGIHPVVLGLSEGLSGSSLNAGNFQAARRLTADRTLRPLWRSICDALGTIIDHPQPGTGVGGGQTPVRLWIDERDIAFLREDVKDIASAMLVRAQTIAALVREGFEPDSVVAAVDADDISLLVHTGAVSVQLQKTGADGSTQAPSAPTPPALDGAGGAGQLPQLGGAQSTQGQAAQGGAAANGQGASAGRGGNPLGADVGLLDRYSPHQPRRPDGKFGHGGGGAAVVGTADAGTSTATASNATGGLPSGWSERAPQDYPASETRKMYNALKEAGVWAPGTEPGYAQYHARIVSNSRKYEHGSELHTDVAGSHVKIMTGDLPREHWHRAASDVEGVVARNPVHPEVTVGFRSGGFEPGPNGEITYGMTTLGRNHMEINPQLYTATPSSTNGWMPAARTNPTQYVIAHEYGHTMGAKDRTAIAEASRQHPGISRYGTGLTASQPQEEAHAEAYAEWSMTGGRTTNAFARAVAESEGWK